MITFEFVTIDRSGCPVVFAPTAERVSEIYRDSLNTDECETFLNSPDWVEVRDEREIDEKIAREIDRMHPYRAGEIISEAVRLGRVFRLPC